MRGTHLFSCPKLKPTCSQMSVKLECLWVQREGPAPIQLSSFSRLAKSCRTQRWRHFIQEVSLSAFYAPSTVLGADCCISVETLSSHWMCTITLSSPRNPMAVAYYYYYHPILEMRTLRCLALSHMGRKWQSHVGDSGILPHT